MFNTADKNGALKSRLEENLRSTIEKGKMRETLEEAQQNCKTEKYYWNAWRRNNIDKGAEIIFEDIITDNCPSSHWFKNFYELMKNNTKRITPVYTIVRLLNSKDIEDRE